MAATTLTAADLLLIIVPLLATMAGLFLHNNRLIHSLSQRFNDFSQKITGELTVIRKEANDFSQEVTGEFALIRKEVTGEFALIRKEVTGELALIRKEANDAHQEAAKDRALIRQEAKNDWTQLQGSIGRLGADVALIKGVILGTDALRQSVTDQDVA